MTRVGESTNKGRGLFATRLISCGELIEEAHVIVVPREQVEQLDATVLGDYLFLWGEEEEETALVLGRGSLCNHSYQPNARFVLHPDRLTIEFVALRDISAGEEIATNYHGDPACSDPVWFEAKP